MKVSIIIPTFNRSDLLADCLKATEETIDINNDEIIVIDSKLLSLSFSQACNQGARQAKGEYLVFLNDDTIPQDNWLDELVRIADKRQDVGIVGSKLLIPKDRTIQHAGVVCSANKTHYHIYRGCPEDFPAANKQREYKVVTGACLLIRKELFNAVGGFDERFINGMEDIDLCLKVDALNKRIIYNPKSVVLHYEGQSENREDNTGFNSRLLKQIWGKKIMSDDMFWLRQDNLTVTGWEGESSNMIYKELVCQ